MNLQSCKANLNKSTEMHHVFLYPVASITQDDPASKLFTFLPIQQHISPLPLPYIKQTVKADFTAQFTLSLSKAVD